MRVLKKRHTVLAQKVPFGEGRLKRLFEGIFLHGGKGQHSI